MKKYAVMILTICGTSSIQTTSVQDIINQNRIHVFNKVLNLQKLNLDDLDGLQHIKNPSNITTINLSFNKISKINSSTFEPFINLEIIDFSDNALMELNDSYFEKNPRIKHLDFSYNKINMITKDVFNDLKNLSMLNLRNNNLSKIALDTFSSIKNKIIIKLSGNPIAQKNLIRLKNRIPNIIIER